MFFDYFFVSLFIYLFFYVLNEKIGFFSSLRSVGRLFWSLRSSQSPKQTFDKLISNMSLFDNHNLVTGKLIMQLVVTSFKQVLFSFAH